MCWAWKLAAEGSPALLRRSEEVQGATQTHSSDRLGLAELLHLFDLGLLGKLPQVLTIYKY